MNQFIYMNACLGEKYYICIYPLLYIHPSNYNCKAYYLVLYASYVKRDGLITAGPFRDSRKRRWELRGIEAAIVWRRVDCGVRHKQELTSTIMRSFAAGKVNITPLLPRLRSSISWHYRLVDPPKYMDREVC